MNLIVHPATRMALEALTKHPYGTVIFDGPQGVGKATASTDLARRLNCRGAYPDECASCRQFLGDNSAALTILARGDKPSIGIEQVRALIQTVTLQPTKDIVVRVVTILDGHLLTTEAQNALLKLLEEPPARTLIIITTTHAEALLATVRSRSQLITFRPVDTSELSLWLEREHKLKPSTAIQRAQAAAGLPGVARAITDEQEPPTDPASLLQLPLFDRLIEASQISDASQAQELGLRLHKSIIAQITSGPNPSAEYIRALDALEVFRRRLRSGVIPKVASEALMVELAS